MKKSNSPACSSLKMLKKRGSLQPLCIDRHIENIIPSFSSLDTDTSSANSSYKKSKLTTSFFTKRMESLSDTLRRKGFIKISRVGKGFQGEVWKIIRICPECPSPDHLFFQEESCEKKKEIGSSDLDLESQRSNSDGNVGGSLIKFDEDFAPDHAFCKREVLAAKVMEKESCEQESILNLKREFEFLSRLRHPNLLIPKELVDDSLFQEEILVMEFFDGISLDSFIKSLQKPLDENSIFRILSQLFDCINYLHAAEICHRDISLLNILIKTENLEIKLIDFGLAHSQDFMMTPVGYVSNRAPEMLAGNRYSKKVDIWMLGIAVLSLVTLQTDWSTEKIMKLTNKQKFWGALEIDYKFAELLHQMLEISPSKRATAENLCHILEKML